MGGSRATALKFAIASIRASVALGILVAFAFNSLATFPRPHAQLFSPLQVHIESGWGE